MLKSNLIEDDGILIITPDGPLASSDFEALAKKIDPYIESHGKLKGVMIDAETFPGWANFSALTSHLKFVNDHHKDVVKVAAVSDSKILSIMPSLVDHFVNAEVKHFEYGDRDKAMTWLRA